MAPFLRLGLTAASLAIASLVLTGCASFYEAGFRSDQARYRELAQPDVSGLSEEEAQAKIAAAEERARILKFIEFRRKIDRFGGGAGSGGGG